MPFRFAGGQLLLSARAAKELPLDVALTIVTRHLSGDWGDLEDEDVRANELALLDGARIFSAYQLGNQRWWVITEADRSATTVLSPEEY